MDPELKLFTDRSSFLQGGRLKARFTVTIAHDIIQAEALPKDGLHNKLNFGHWSRNYDMQRESG
jgi:hypothetical protein